MKLYSYVYLGIVLGNKFSLRFVVGKCFNSCSSVSLNVKQIARAKVVAKWKSLRSPDIDREVGA